MVFSGWALKRAGRKERKNSYPRLELLEDRCLPTGSSLLALGADAGGGPQVRVLDGATGTEKFSFMAYDPAFTGGVRVATGDVNGDGIMDIVTAPGPGGGPDVRVWDGSTGKLLREFMAYDPNFTGGVSVAVGDVNGDGYADIITGAGLGGGPNVKIFSGKDGTQLQSYFAYDPSFRGGVNVAAGDVNGDGRADVITGAGPGGGPQVNVFSGAGGSLLQSFMAFNPAFSGGVNVAGGDVNGDGFADIITGAGAGGGPQVTVFNGTDGTVLSSFFAFDPSFLGGVRVGAGFFNGTNAADIITGAGPGGGPHIRVFTGANPQQVNSFFAFSPGFTGGTFVDGPSVPVADTIIDWNRILLQTIQSEKTPPPAASRAMAMVQAAVYDSVNAIFKTYQVYHVSVTAAADTSPDAAAAAAADRVLDNLYPDQAARFDAVLAADLTQVANASASADGVSLGQAVANNIVSWRSTDGSTTVVPYTPGSAPGQWRPTPPGFLPALSPQWAQLTPFAMTSDTQFLPPGPPALSSAAYAAGVNEIESLGAANSTTRTADQTQIAVFWADATGTTCTPPGHWNLIAQQQALNHNFSLEQDAHLFALLDVTEADAAIVAWNAKYTYNFWRPITAIQDAAQAGNPAVIPDPTWTPLLTTPNFPEYTSGHSTFSAAAAQVLSSIFGANVSFTTNSPFMPNVVRTYTSFVQAADEAGRSRIYGGIHFQFTNVDSLASGTALGNYVVANFLGTAS
jgi:hypothetical protein